MKAVPLGLVAVLVGCAATPPCLRKPAPSEPAGPAAEWSECGQPPGYDGHAAVVRYAGGAADSRRLPERTISGPRTLLCSPGSIHVGPAGEVYVLNRLPFDAKPPFRAGWTSWITVYDSAARGDAAPTRVLGIATPGFGSGSSLGVDPSGHLFVRSERAKWLDSGSVAVFEAEADGDVEPIRVLAGARTGLRWPGELTIDRHGNLYAVNAEPEGDDTVRIWGPDAEGNLEPCRVIAGDRTGLDEPVGLAVDSEDRLYVANHGSRRSGEVMVYEARASGNALPQRTLSANEIYDGMRELRHVAIGRRDSLYVRSASNLSVFTAVPTDTTRPSRTFFNRAPGLFVLDRHDTLFALRGSEIVVYPPGYSGGRGEIRTFTSSGIDLRDVNDIALDSGGRLYLAMDSVVHVFPAGATGEVAPSRTIAGGRTRMREIRSIALDRADRLYVANGPRGPGGGPALLVYAPGARAEDQPVRVLLGRNLEFVYPPAIAFDSQRDLYLAGDDWSRSGQVRVFRQGAQGNAEPARVLAGERTQLNNPVSVAFGRGDTLYVLNVFDYLGGHRCGPFAASNAKVTVYPPRASGDVEPVRSIVVVKDRMLPDGSRGSILPWGIDVDTSGAVQVWHRRGSLLYGPGADGFVSPAAQFTETREDGAEVRGVSVASDGAIYQSNVPTKARMRC